MSNDSNFSGLNIFLTVLLALFLGLKIAGVSDMSWWWVWSPIWLPLGLGIAVFFIGAIIEWCTKD